MSVPAPVGHPPANPPGPPVPPGAPAPQGPPAPPPKPSRWQVALAYGVMMAPTIGKVIALMAGFFGVGIFTAKMVATISTPAVYAGAGVLVGLMSAGILMALGLSILIIWTVPSDDEPDQTNP